MYMALSDDQCDDYDAVKSELLKAYELIPTVYRHKFRNCRKELNRTHVEFARMKQDAFKQLLRSE